MGDARFMTPNLPSYLRHPLLIKSCLASAPNNKNNTSPRQVARLNRAAYVTCPSLYLTPGILYYRVYLYTLCQKVNLHPPPILAFGLLAKQCIGSIASESCLGALHIHKASLYFLTCPASLRRPTCHNSHPPLHMAFLSPCSIVGKAFLFFSTGYS